MFITSPSFEQKVPDEIRSPGDKYWLMTLLSTESPWYLMSYRVTEGSMTMTQSAVIAWESALLSAIESVGSENVLSLRCIRRKDSMPGAWEMSDVSELWFSNWHEVEEFGSLVLRLRDSGEMLGCRQFRPVPVGTRKLVFATAAEVS